MTGNKGSLNQWRRDKGYTVPRISKSLLKSYLITILSAGAIGFAGAPWGKNFFRGFDELTDAIPYYLSDMATSSLNKGEISGDDYAKITGEVKKIKDIGVIDVLRESIAKRESPIKILNAKKEEVRSKGLSELKETREYWNEKRVKADHVLDNLARDYNEENIVEYNGVIKEMKEKIDINPYTSRFNKIKQENIYFNDLSQKVTQLVLDLKEKKYDENTIAREIGLYFSMGISGVKFSEVSLLGRTRELSGEVTDNLSGYRINLESCLTTSQKR